MLFSWYLLVKTTRSSLFSAGKASNTPSQSYIRAKSTLQPYVIISLQEFWSPFSFTSYHTGPLVHYIDDSMLIGRSVQKVATTQLIGKIFVCQKVGNKSDKNSATFFFHVSEISRRSRGAGHVEISLLRWRINCCIWPLLQTKKEV